jgi:hypothetical protein
VPTPIPVPEPTPTPIDIIQEKVVPEVLQGINQVVLGTTPQLGRSATDDTLGYDGLMRPATSTTASTDVVVDDEKLKNFLQCR